MHLSFRQPIGVGVEQAIAVLCSEAYYEALGDLGPLGSPEVLSVDRAAQTVVSVRWRFKADLPGPARAALDPARLTWVIRSSFSETTARFEVLPDHYADLLSCSGSFTFSPDPLGCVQEVAADLKVRFPLVGGKVERVIADGLREHVAAEADAITAFAEGG